MLDTVVPLPEGTNTPFTNWFTVYVALLIVICALTIPLAGKITAKLTTRLIVLNHPCFIVKRIAV